MKNFAATLRLFSALTILTGIIYPAVITMAGRTFFPSEAQGSPVRYTGTVRGSALVGQKFTQDQFFHARPSAGDYGTMPSGASNLSPLAMKQGFAVEARMKSLPGAGADLYYASGSGLDPHISVESAAAQSERVARARCTSLDEVRIAIAGQTRQAMFEPPLINVLQLNLFLEGKGYVCGK